jgi:hypothetical protein
VIEIGKSLTANQLFVLHLMHEVRARHHCTWALDNVTPEDVELLLNGHSHQTTLAGIWLADGGQATIEELIAQGYFDQPRARAQGGELDDMPTALRLSSVGRAAIWRPIGSQGLADALRQYHNTRAVQLLSALVSA